MVFGGVWNSKQPGSLILSLDYIGLGIFEILGRLFTLIDYSTLQIKVLVIQNVEAATHF